MVRLLLLFCFLAGINAPPAFAADAKITEVFRFEDGSSPSRLIEGNDGAFYGFTYERVYRFNPAAGGFRTLCRFGAGEFISSLAFGSDGLLYGSTSDLPMLFRVNFEGRVTIVHLFEETPENPRPGNLILGPDGSIYGTTTYGSPQVAGTIFRLTTSGTFTTLVDFGVRAPGVSPRTLVVGHDQALWGTLSDASIFRVSLDGQISNPIATGSLPAVGVRMFPSSDGNYHIFTDYVFPNVASAMLRLTPDGELSEIKRLPFTQLRGSSIVITSGRDGQFYGVAGSDSDNAGVIYQVNLQGDYSVVASFPRQVFEAGIPLVARNGAFYGVTRGVRNSMVIYRASVPGQGRINLPPFAKYDVVRLPEPGQQLSIRVLANDKDVDGDPLSIVGVDAPLHGTAVISATNPAKIDYTASADPAVIQDEFWYTVTDGQGHSSQARVLFRQPVAGHFQGLLTDQNPKLNGSLSLQITRAGTISGRLWMGGITWVIRGSFDGSNNFTAKLRNENTYEVGLSLALVSSPEEGVHISASINYADVVRTIDLTAPKAASQVAGEYTVWLPAESSWKDLDPVVEGDGDDIPDRPNPLRRLSGSGYGLMKVSASGAVRTVGRTPNNRPFTAANYLNGELELSFFAATEFQPGTSPRPTQGWVSGKVTFDDASSSDASGTLRWRLPYRGYGYYVPPLAETNLRLLASKYVAPADKEPPIPFTSVSFTATDGGLPAELGSTLKFDGNDIFQSPNTEASPVHGNFNLASGLMQGRMQLTVNSFSIPFQGVVFQKQNRAVGLFQISPPESKTGAVEMVGSTGAPQPAP